MRAIHGTRFVSAEPCSGRVGNGEVGTMSKCPMGWQIPLPPPVATKPCGQGMSLNFALVGSSGVQGSLCQGL